MRFQSVYTRGASAIGVPGWPELAACTASIDSVRIVLMDSRSSSASVMRFSPNCQVTARFNGK
ncbi:MAG: hypothetical protein V9G16_15560 [Nitrosomonas sp.]